MNIDRRRRNRLLITLVILIGFLPLLAAIAITQLAPQWRPWGTANHGNLVRPPRLLSSTGLEPLDSEQLSEGFLVQKWTLLYLASPPCGDPCREQLQKIRQVRLSLGKDAPRVQRLYVSADPEQPSDLDELRALYSGLRLARASKTWLTLFVLDQQQALGLDRLYLVDPQGYLMMYYPPGINGSAILKDLKRLLRASRVG